MKSHTLFAFALLLMCLALHASAQTPDGNSSVIVTRLQFKAETLTSYKGEYIYIERAALIEGCETRSVRPRSPKILLPLCCTELLKGLVARDGIEPPTPAFSGPLIDRPKWLWNQQMSLKVKGFCKKLHRIA